MRPAVSRSEQRDRLSLSQQNYRLLLRQWLGTRDRGPGSQSPKELRRIPPELSLGRFHRFRSCWFGGELVLLTEWVEARR